MLGRTPEDIDRYLDLPRKPALDARTWMVTQTGDQLDMLRHMKFEPIGRHLINGHTLNLVEHINQTWTYFVALVAVKELLILPSRGGRLPACAWHRCEAASRHHEHVGRPG
jgi:hypothetical protein